MRVILEGIYLCRSRREVGMVRHRFVRERSRFEYLVEYARQDGVLYAEPSLGKVDQQGRVWGDTEDPRDLVEFIEFYNPETVEGETLQ